MVDGKEWPLSNINQLGEQTEDLRLCNGPFTSIPWMNLVPLKKTNALKVLELNKCSLDDGMFTSFYHSIKPRNLVVLILGTGTLMQMIMICQMLVSKRSRGWIVSES